MGILKTTLFSLKHTVECGQFFSYKKEGNSYLIWNGNKRFRARQVNSSLYFSGADKSFVEGFFSLETDYKKVYSALSKDRHIRAAIKKYNGLRVIRQEPWECLISFVCSAAANIPKIQKNVTRLTGSFGKNKCFPAIGRINNLEMIKQCGCGFRSGYILRINKAIKSKKYFDRLKAMGYENAKRELMKLPGVGEKVADCVLLYSMGFYEAFPVDVWVRRVMQELYFNSKTVSDSAIREFARGYFGSCAGIAQQYLFCWKRNRQAKI